MWTAVEGNVVIYDTIEEFNVDSKAECDQLNLPQETKTNANHQFVQYMFNICKGRPEGIRRLMEERICESVEF